MNTKSLVQLLVGVMAVLAVIQTAPTAAHSQLTDISPTAISSMKASTTTFTIGGALSGSTALLLLKTHAYIPTSATFPAYDCDNLPAPTEMRSTENATVDASSQVTFTTSGLLHGSYTLCFQNATDPAAVEEFPMYPVAIAGPVHPKNSRVDCCGDFQVGNVYSCSILTFDDLGQLAGSTEEECQMGVCVKDGQNGVIYEPLKTVPTFTELGMFNFTFNATVSGCYGSAMGYIKDTPVNGGIAAHFKIAPGEIRGWASTAECSADPGVPCSVVNRDMWGNPVSKCGYDSTGTITCTGTIAD